MLLCSLLWSKNGKNWDFCKEVGWKSQQQLPTAGALFLCLHFWKKRESGQEKTPHTNPFRRIFLSKVIFHISPNFWPQIPTPWVGKKLVPVGKNEWKSSMPGFDLRKSFVFKMIFVLLGEITESPWKVLISRKRKKLKNLFKTNKMKSLAREPNQFGYALRIHQGIDALKP